MIQVNAVSCCSLINARYRAVHSQVAARADCSTWEDELGAGLTGRQAGRQGSALADSSAVPPYLAKVCRAGPVMGARLRHSPGLQPGYEEGPRSSLEVEPAGKGQDQICRQ